MRPASSVDDEEVEVGESEAGAQLGEPDGRVSAGTPMRMGTPNAVWMSDSMLAGCSPFRKGYRTEFGRVD